MHKMLLLLGRIDRILIPNAQPQNRKAEYFEEFCYSFQLRLEHYKPVI